MSPEERLEQVVAEIQWAQKEDLEGLRAGYFTELGIGDHIPSWDRSTFFQTGWDNGKKIAQVLLGSGQIELPPKKDDAEEGEG
jgi:hypothetical protein